MGWEGRAEKRVACHSTYYVLGGAGLVFVVFLVCQQMFLSFLEYSLPLLVDSMDKSYVFFLIY